MIKPMKTWISSCRYCGSLVCNLHPSVLDSGKTDCHDDRIPTHHCQKFGLSLTIFQLFWQKLLIFWICPLSVWLLEISGALLPRRSRFVLAWKKCWFTWEQSVGGCNFGQPPRETNQLFPTKIRCSGRYLNINWVWPEHSTWQLLSIFRALSLFPSNVRFFMNCYLFSLHRK